MRALNTYKVGDKVRVEYWERVLVGTIECVSVTTRTYVDRSSTVTTYDIRYGGDTHTTRDVTADLIIGYAG